MKFIGIIIEKCLIDQKWRPTLNASLEFLQSDDCKFLYRLNFYFAGGPVAVRGFSTITLVKDEPYFRTAHLAVTYSTLRGIITTMTGCCQQPCILPVINPKEIIETYKDKKTHAIMEC